MDKLKLADLEWTGNSKQMFDEIMGRLPLMYRAAIKKKFEVWVNQKGERVIREWNIKHTLEKYAPAAMREQMMPIYEALKTEEEA
ncbi:MAG: hypothetical protein SOR89_06545 [Ndongobacter sp.]|nr:hypothetical protein [Ndongobacter sp.]